MRERASWAETYAPTSASTRSGLPEPPLILSGAATITALAGDAGQAGDVAAAFTLVQGATGTILGTGGTDFSLALYDMTLCFAHGMLRFRDLDGTLEVYENGSRYAETHALIPNHSRWHQYDASFEQALGAYLDSIRADAPPPVPGLAGVVELQFEAALRRAVAERRPVDVQGEFPLPMLGVRV